MHYLNQVTHLERASDLYGRAFEHWIALELRSYLSYRRIKKPLAFWRSQQQTMIQLLPQTLGIDKKTLMTLDAMRKQRNVADYFHKCGR